jgi:hypothetical protein
VEAISTCSSYKVLLAKSNKSCSGFLSGNFAKNQTQSGSIIMQNHNKNITVVSVILILLSILCYYHYFGNAWYLQDDYLTINNGGAYEPWEFSNNIISWLYEWQQRFQPVRLIIFGYFVHFFGENYAFGYNFILHLINLILLFLVVRSFRVDALPAFLIVLLFSFFGQNRMIESPSAMVGGSGLNTLFTLITVICLFKAFASENLRSKLILLFISYLSFSGFVFSYEVAFPMILPIIFVFVVTVSFQTQKNRTILVNGLLLLPYLVPIVIFIYGFHNTQSSYGGAKVVLTTDIFIKFLSYCRALLHGTMHFDATFRWLDAALFIILFFAGLYYLRKADDDDAGRVENNPLSKNYLFLFLFGLLWFFSSVCLFTVNQWGSKTAVMYHHLYLMSAGFSIFLIPGILFVLSIRKLQRLKGVFTYILAPVILITLMNYHIDYAKAQKKKTTVLREIKNQLKTHIPDITAVDAVLIKNFLAPESLNQYQISHFNGTLLQWFDYKKYLNSGDHITSTIKNKVVFKGPLSYYECEMRSKNYQVDNNRLALFYYDSDGKTLIPYFSEIDFENNENLHQTRLVYSQTKNSMALNAILYSGLSKPKKRFISIEFSDKISSIYFDESTIIDVNNQPVNKLIIDQNSIYFDISDLAVNCNYFFLYANFGKYKFLKNMIKAISLTKSAPSVMPLVINRKHMDINCYSGYQPGDLIRFDSRDNVTFINWHDIESTHRWTNGTNGIIKINFVTPDYAVKQYGMYVKGFTNGPMDVSIYLNQRFVGNFEHGLPEKMIPIDANLINPCVENVIEFQAPHAKQGSDKDQRILGFALEKLRFTAGYQIGELINFDSKENVTFINWHDIEPTHRWANGTKGIVKVNFAPLHSAVEQYGMHVKGFTNGPKDVSIYVNHCFAGRLENGLIDEIIAIDANLINPGTENVVEFQIPDAKQASDKDPRVLGFALQELRFTAGYQIGDLINFDSRENVTFNNWHDIEPTHRWANGTKGIIKIHFAPPHSNVEQYGMHVKGFTNGAMDVSIYVNHRFAGRLENGLTDEIIGIDANLINPGAENVIEFQIPDAKQASDKDLRVLGFALQELRFTYSLSRKTL